MSTRTVIRGDSDSFTVTFYKVSTGTCNKVTKTPIDITGWNIRFTVRKDVPLTSVTTDIDALIHKTGDIIDGTTGQCTFTITGEDTNINPGEYLYDIQYIKPPNTQGISDIKSIRRAKYIIIGDITRDEVYP